MSNPRPTQPGSTRGASGVRPRRGRFARLFKPPRKLRFTREGKYYVGLTVAIGIAAVNTSNNLLYLVLGWMLAMIVASGVLAELSLRGLAAERLPQHRIFAGQPCLMGVALENRKRRLASYSIEVEDLLGETTLGKRCYFLKVPGRRRQTASYRHVFARRGIVRFDGVRLSTRFPFALFQKSLDVDSPGEVLVFPAIHPVTVPPPAPAQFGEDPRPRAGRSGDFFGLRELRPGDDPRDVHWRSSARHGRLMVREHEDETRRRAVVVLDNALPADATPDAAEGLEHAISLAASLATAYLGHHYAVGLVTRGVAVPVDLGPGQLTRVLRTLALLEASTVDVPFAGGVEPGAERVLVPRAGSATLAAAAPRAASPSSPTRVLEA